MTNLNIHQSCHRPKKILFVLRDFNEHRESADKIIATISKDVKRIWDDEVKRP